jgi:hypothetical protein
MNYADPSILILMAEKHAMDVRGGKDDKDRIVYVFFGAIASISFKFLSTLTGF